MGKIKDLIHERAVNAKLSDKQLDEVFRLVGQDPVGYTIQEKIDSTITQVLQCNIPDGPVSGGRADDFNPSIISKEETCNAVLIAKLQLENHKLKDALNDILNFECGAFKRGHSLIKELSNE